MPVTRARVPHLVTHHAPTLEEGTSITHIRKAAEEMIYTILDECPGCADQQAAIRHVREAMHTAMDAIVLKGLV